MRQINIKDKHIYAFILGFVIIWIVFLVPLPKQRSVDLYYYYNRQCKEAHAANMSYSYCSGFWLDPIPEHLSNPCVIHPLENPETEIPHGTPFPRNRNQIIIVYGLYGYLTTPEIIIV